MLRGVWTVLLAIFLPGFASAAQIELVSKASPAGLTGHSSQPSISGDGRYVAFLSEARGLVPSRIDTNGADDVFLYDRVTREVRLVSHSPKDPLQTIDFGAMDGRVSADGRFVAFVSVSPLVPPDRTRLGGDVHLFDRTTGAVTLVSRSARSATVGGDDLSGEPAISADGAFIAFTSRATNLDPTDGNGVILKDVFLYSRNP